MKLTLNILKEIISEGIVLEQLGVLDQFELDLETIKEEVLCVEKACRILLALFIALGLIFIIAMIYSAVRFIKP